MQFIISQYASTTLKNVCLLTKDNWDDFSFKTSFYLRYVSNSETYDIGPIKIMKKGIVTGRVTIEDTSFETLNENYCSLGQEQTYYEQLMVLEDSIRNDILCSLRDCVYEHDIYEEFKKEPAFETSLLRSVSTYQIETTFKSILEGNVILTPYSFDLKIKKNNSPTIHINVWPNTFPPSNVHAIIGRNASGKTQLISSIISKLTNEKNRNLKFALDIDFNPTFNPATNNTIVAKFSKLISVIFSPFDSTQPPQINSAQNMSGLKYNYIGLKQWDKDKKEENNDGELLLINKPPKVLHSELKTAFIKCCSGSYKERLENALRILSSDPIFCEHDFEYLIGIQDTTELNGKLTELCKNLSSGHKIILLSIVKLVELTEENTLVLIDEPENHLHPPLLSAYLRVLSELMRSRNGVAIIATHSPVVIQEIPKSCVHIIDRHGDITSVRNPQIETFGENVSILTHEVFGLEVMNSGFYNLISQKVNEGLNYAEIMHRFSEMLGSDGQSILRSLLYERDKNV